MNFADFQTWRAHSLLNLPGLLDCAETNLYRSLASLQPAPGISKPNSPVYRCDLARAWLTRYGLPESHSRQALVCRGVRHALELIFGCLSRQRAQVWIPGDVYPVYLDLAQAAGISTRCFNTLPQPEVPTTPPIGEPEYLLVTNPWKPLGRFLTSHETDELIRWLDQSPNRKLLIDCVYDLGRPFHDTTRRLLQTGRAILLHSTTKGWLRPKTFGVALMPEPNEEFETVFRANPPDPEQLQLAQQFLSTDSDCPDRITAAVQSRAAALFNAMPASVHHAFILEPLKAAPGCYFFPVRISANELLARHQILAIPSSAFGSTWEGSILTSLAPAFAPSHRGGAQ